MDCTGPEKYLEMVSRNLSPSRLAHCVRVAEEARRLGIYYGEDPEKAYLAGLVHDYARDLGQEALRRFLPAWVDGEAYAIPGIWHALAGPAILIKDLGIRNYQILHAVRWHATACENMSRFDKIIFVADLAEEGREFQEALEIRRKIREDLEGGYLLALEVKLQYLLSTGRLIYPASIKAWNRETMTR